MSSMKLTTVTKKVGASTGEDAAAGAGAAALLGDGEGVSQDGLDSGEIEGFSEEKKLCQHFG